MHSYSIHTPIMIDIFGHEIVDGYLIIITSVLIKSSVFYDHVLGNEDINTN